jgi:hypothetical protein
LAIPKLRQTDLACPIWRYPFGSGGNRVATRPWNLFVLMCSSIISLIKSDGGGESFWTISPVPLSFRYPCYFRTKCDFSPRPLFVPIDDIVHPLKSKIFKSGFFYHDISPYLSVMQFGREYPWWDKERWRKKDSYDYASYSKMILASTAIAPFA